MILKNPALTLAQRFGNPAILAFCALSAACITVNVNFPESAVQQAANDFVSDLYKDKKTIAASGDKADADGESESVKKTVKKKSKATNKAGKVPASQPATPAPADAKPTTWLYELLIPSASAQEVNTNTPKAQEIKARMHSRIAEIAAWKAKGALCETDDGMLKMDPSKAGAQASELAHLVKTENADRDALYEEVQTANHITDRKQTKIRAFFAAAFQQKAPPACK